MRSFIRLMHRRNVDFPQPDGPMSAVTCCSGISRETSSSACVSSYRTSMARASMTVRPVPVRERPPRPSVGDSATESASVSAVFSKLVMILDAPYGSGGPRNAP
jgi:hypothetical protein